MARSVVRVASCLRAPCGMSEWHVLCWCRTASKNMSLPCFAKATHRVKLRAKRLAPSVEALTFIHCALLRESWVACGWTATSSPNLLTRPSPGPSRDLRHRHRDAACCPVRTYSVSSKPRMPIGRIDCIGCTLGRIGTSRIFEPGCLEQRWLVQLSCLGQRYPGRCRLKLPAEHHPGFGVRARIPS